jgi:F-type H+-transporting ATPase subunit epsilon
MVDAAHNSAHHKLHCIVVTPEETALEADADFIALPLFDGEIGIAPLHSPLIGRLGYGEMRIRNGGTTATYYLDGGFVQVVNNVVSVLTNRALPAKSVDAVAAETQLLEAQQRPANTDERLAIRDRLIAQSRAQLRVARRSN